jgi:hypothetical protein
MRIHPKFLSSSERAALMSCVRSHREDHGIARRANAILLLDDGESCAQIAKFLYLDDDTIRSWYRAYQEGGWDALSTDGWKGGQSRMTSAQEAELCVCLSIPRACGHRIHEHVATDSTMMWPPVPRHVATPLRETCEAI